VAAIPARGRYILNIVRYGRHVLSDMCNGVKALDHELISIFLYLPSLKIKLLAKGRGGSHYQILQPQDK
jgi:hypothetical protein